MKKSKVINPKNLPLRPPLIGTLVWWLVFDKLDVPGWGWGVMGTLLAVVWAVWVFEFFTRDLVNVLKADDEP